MSKKTTTKKTRLKKAVSKKTTSKKAAVKSSPSRTSSKKAAASKTSSVKKKTTTSGKVAKSSPKKGAASKKKSVLKKSAVAAGASSKKKNSKSTRPALAKAARAKKKTTTLGKSKAASKKKTRSAAKKEKVVNTVTLGSAREAARRLASAAGLAPLAQRAIPTDDHTTKRKRVRRSPLNQEQLAEFREILYTKRREVLSVVKEMEREALGRQSGSLSSFPQHLADQGSDEYDQSLALGLAANQRTLLEEIDAALERIDNGTYGVCETLSIPISKKRLDATPWARLSLEGAQQHDSFRPS